MRENYEFVAKIANTHLTKILWPFLRFWKAANFCHPAWEPSYIKGWWSKIILIITYIYEGGKQKWHTFRMIALVLSKLKEKFDVWGMKRWWSWKQGKYETRSAFANLLSEGTGSSSLLEGRGKYTDTFPSTSS